MFNVPPPNVVLYDQSPSGVTVFNRRARPLWDRARFLARVYGMADRLTGHSPDLPLLADALIGKHESCRAMAAVRMIPPELIVGGSDRSGDFDRHFLPLKDSLAERWMRVASMVLQGVSLPPIEVVMAGDSYYVIDGHHRVSVARMLHMAAVETVVVSCYTDGS